MGLTLAKIANEPIKVRCGDQEFRFSELPMDALARLQAWIEENVLHPLEAIRGRLDGFTPEQQEILLEGARRDAQNWPPRVCSPEGFALMAGSRPAQVELLHEGLKVHHPEATRDDAERFLRSVNLDEGDGQRLFLVLFGLDEPGAGVGEGRGPKGGGGGRRPRRSTSS